MLMADDVAVFFIVLALLLAHVGVWLVCRGVWESHVARGAEQMSRSLVATLLAGVIPTLGALGFVAIAANLGGIGKAFAALAASAFLLFAHAGLAGAVLHIGRKLGADEAPWRTTTRGGIALALAWLFPILGWFVLFPLSIVLGAGASSIALVRAFASKLAPSPALAHGTSAQ